jgi:hypothetical protein
VGPVSEHCNVGQGVGVKGDDVGVVIGRQETAEGRLRTESEWTVGGGSLDRL